MNDDDRPDPRWKDPAIIEMNRDWVTRLYNGEVLTRLGPNNWVPARPLGYASYTLRFRAAWLVFTGRADALVWPGGQ